MEITIDLESCKIVATLEKPHPYSYAVLISKLTGQAYTMTIPQLIEALEKAAEYKRNQASRPAAGGDGVREYSDG